MHLFNLKGKTAQVTGAAQEIGESLAHGLAEAGANVAVVDINQEEATAAQIAEATGVKTKAYSFDVTVPENATKLVEQVVADLGGLHIAFHNAGKAQNVAAEDMSLEEWQRMMDLNLNSVFYGTQAAGRHMLENGGGSIVNTISPGYIGTELLQSDSLAPLRKEWEDLTPQRRIGSPDELKGIAVYLASDASSYATAADFIVDGGCTAV